MWQLPSRSLPRPHELSPVFQCQWYISLDIESDGSLRSAAALRYCWRTPSAPEARGTLAGGGAKRNHRKRHNRATRPERAPDPSCFCREFWSVAPPGREKSLLVRPGGCARAPPPANIRRPSEARNSFAEFASSIALTSLSHSLIDQGMGKRCQSQGAPKLRAHSHFIYYHWL